MAKRWSDLSDRSRRLVIAAAIAEAILKTALVIDIRRRPASQIRGSKRMWIVAAVLVCQGTLGTAQWRPCVLPADGHQICPLVAIRRAAVGQFRGVTPFPERAWVSRTLSPLVWQRWAWCMSRSTVAVARVLGISSSNPDG